MIEDGANTHLIKALMATIFWIGGFAAAPMIFMATMGIFRNLTGMANGFTKGLRGGMMSRGKQARERGFGAWKAEKNAAKDLEAQRRGAVFGAGSRFTRSGQAARAQAQQRIAQQMAEQGLKDPGYTWQGDGDLNRLVAETASAQGMRDEVARAANDPTHYLHGKYYKNGSLDRNLLEQDIQRAEAMRSRYGTTALRQMAHTQAIAGKGYKADEADKVWRAAGDIAGGDDHVLASLVARGRGAATSAGLGAIGGAGFVGTLNYAKTLAGGAATADDHNKFIDGVLDSSGPGTLFHPSMTNESIQTVSNRLVERLVNSEPGKDRDRRLADVANAYDQLRGLPGGKGDIAAEHLMGVDLFGKPVRKMVEDARQNEGFLEKRFEYPKTEYADKDRARTPTDPGGPVITTPTTGL